MSTPENKFEAGIAKVKSIWASWEVYIVAAVCLIVGAIVGYKLHP